jgi:hypothetical protein
MKYLLLHVCFLGGEKINLKAQELEFRWLTSRERKDIPYDKFLKLSVVNSTKCTEMEFIKVQFR